MEGKKARLVFRKRGNHMSPFKFFYVDEWRRFSSFFTLGVSNFMEIDILLNIFTTENAKITLWSPWCEKINGNKMSMKVSVIASLKKISEPTTASSRFFFRWVTHVYVPRTGNLYSNRQHRAKFKSGNETEESLTNDDSLCKTFIVVVKSVNKT